MNELSFGNRLVSVLAGTWPSFQSPRPDTVTSTDGFGRRLLSVAAGTWPTFQPEIDAARNSPAASAEEAAWREAVEESQTALSPVLRTALILHERGEYAHAEVWYERAIEADHAGAMNNLGLMYYEQGRLDEAALLFRRAADTGDVDAMFNLGSLLDLELNSPEEAAVWYQRAVEADHIDAMNNLGMTYAEKGRFDEAIALLKRAADAGDEDARNNLADVNELMWAQKAADRRPTIRPIHPSSRRRPSGGPRRRNNRRTRARKQDPDEK